MAPVSSSPDDGHAAPRRLPVTEEGPRLVARLYARGPDSLRARMLECLLKPLGPLGVAAVASGAFLDRVLHHGSTGLRMAADAAPRYTTEQVLELARFVVQVQPEVLRQLAALAAQAPPGGVALTATALLMLVQQSRREPRG